MKFDLSMTMLIDFATKYQLRAMPMVSLNPILCLRLQK
jgi:hypothetical protein